MAFYTTPFNFAMEPQLIIHPLLDDFMAGKTIFIPQFAGISVTDLTVCQLFNVVLAGQLLRPDEMVKILAQCRFFALIEDKDTGYAKGNG